MEPVASHLMLQTVSVVLELLVRVVRSHRQLVGVITHHVREHILKHREWKSYADSNTTSA